MSNLVHIFELGWPLNQVFQMLDDLVELVWIPETNKCKRSQNTYKDCE